ANGGGPSKMRLYYLDGATGAQLWVGDLGIGYGLDSVEWDTAPSISPSDGTVFVLGGTDGFALRAFSAAGDFLWQSVLLNATVSGPAVLSDDGTMLFVQTDGFGLTSLNATDGSYVFWTPLQ